MLHRLGEAVFNFMSGKSTSPQHGPPDLSGHADLGSYAAYGKKLFKVNLSLFYARHFLDKGFLLEDQERERFSSQHLSGT